MPRPLSPLKRAAWLAEYAGIRFGCALFGWLSPAGRMRVARAGGAFLARFVPFRSKLIREQLRASFPEMSPVAVEALIPDVYMHVIAFGLETLAMSRLTPVRLREQIDADDDLLRLLDELKASGKGFVVATGHMGNWEWAGACLVSIVGFDVYSVAKPMHNPMAEEFIRGVRERYGVKIVTTRSSPRPLLAHLRKGGMVALVADQDARRSGIFVDFFGRPASTATGPAWLAWRLGVPLFPMWTFRDAEGRLSGHAAEPIHPDPSAPEEAEIRRLTEYHVGKLEAAIRQDPAQYFWVHRRWKTRPPRPGEAPPDEEAPSPTEDGTEDTAGAPAERAD